ncbi:hypothetical protein Tco_1235600 [Tanacetum coccineum]|uniref:Uncharacterized protein n=1 Tax=Tanacetum coccineum TaxID=301880 RepID=A0ABQ5EKU0_9ASTR
MDRENGIFNGPLKVEFCVAQSKGSLIQISRKSILLQKALYGLKHAPRAGNTDPQSPKGIFINQAMYALDNLKKLNYGQFYQARPIKAPQERLNDLYIPKGHINMGLWYPTVSGFELQHFKRIMPDALILAKVTLEGYSSLVYTASKGWMSKKQNALLCLQQKADYVALSAELC